MKATTIKPDVFSGPLTNAEKSDYAGKREITMTSISNITAWSNPKEMINSQWGEISYGEWCEKEAARMRANGGHVAIRTDKEGRVCIAKIRNQTNETNY